MDNIWKPRGALKSQKPDAGGAVLRTYPMLGIVKDNVDPTRSGRIRVYISALGSPDPDDEKNWTPVLYMSPFFGMTDTTGGNKDFGSFKANPASYGMWTSPPDIGTIVICMFINGDPNFGFYVGSIPDAEAMRMVPAIGANFITEDVIFNESEAEKFGGATKVPVTNMNTNNSDEADNSTFIDSPKPVHSFQASIMFQQGILRDPVRGPISSSAQRESPSRVGWGVSTPGRPIYEGGFTDETITDAAGNASQQAGLKIVSRRGGHSIVMDDGDLIGQDNLIRIRTSLGHQILMSDDGQTLMLLHSNGQSYIELGKEGTVDVYSTNSINLRTHGDLNLHADNNININAAKKLNIHADEININSENKITQKSGSDFMIHTQGKHTHKVDGAMSMAATGQASYASSSSTFINGSVINLNTGSTSTTPQNVDPIPIIAQTDTLFSDTKGWAAAPGKLLTIVSRAPAHTPWVNAGQGVDVKVNLNASAQLPQTPKPAVSSTNSSASTTSNYTGTTISATASVPPVAAASGSLDKSSTSALVSAAAVSAATGPAASAVRAGAGVVKNAQGNATGIAVGVTGLSASALQAAGNIKPGTANLVNRLVASGKTIAQSMPSNLFTGQNGSINLTSLVNNVTAQANTTATNIQQAQTALIKTGLLTGKESSSAMGGPVLSSAINGVNATVNAIKNVGIQLNPLQNNIIGSVDGVMKTIASGNFATKLSQDVMSGLSGLDSSSKALSKGLGNPTEDAKGIAANAFKAVTDSFKSFKAGVPQNLKAITDKNKQDAEVAENNTSDSADPYAGLSQDQIKQLGNADPTDPIIRARLGLPALPGIQSVSSVASGVSNLPGGTKTIASVVNNLPGASNLVPGTAGVKTLIDNAVTATTNNVGMIAATTSSFGTLGSNAASVAGITGSLPNLRAGLTSAEGLLNKLKPGSLSLTGLAATGLSPAAAAQLNSAIASLNSGGPIAIKMPTVAVNTTDRGSLTDAVGSLLPDGVPAPNFSGIPTVIKSTAEAQKQNTSENAKKVEELNIQYTEQRNVVEKAEAAYFKAKADLLPGNPAIQTAKVTWDNEIKKQAEISKQVAGLLGIGVNVPGPQNTQLSTAEANLERLLRTNPFTGQVGGTTDPGKFESGDT